MPKDLIANRICQDDIARIPPKRAKDLSKHGLVPGDIIFARRGDIGRCALVTPGEKGWLCGTGCLRARLTKEVSAEFLIYILEIPQTVAWLNTNAVGQTMLNLNTTILAELPIPFPPLPEQRAIAAILGTWDRAIALTERRLAAAEQRKKALMQQLLTGRVRFPEFAKSTEKQSCKYGDLPADWKIIHLESVAEVNAESIGESSDPNRKYLYIDLSSVDRGIITMPTEHQAFGDLPSRARRILHRGDVIMATVRPNLLGFAVCDFKPENVLCSTGFALISPKELSDSHFIYQSLYSDIILKQVYGLVTGSNYPAINASEVKKLWFVWPTSAEERRNIAATLDACDRELDLLRRKQDALHAHKRGLMQRLLTGRVRVKGGSGLKPAGQTHEAP